MITLAIPIDLVDQLKWVIARILLGDSFDGGELNELWNALCNGDIEGIESLQKDIASQWKQAEMDDLHDNRYGDYCC